METRTRRCSSRRYGGASMTWYPRLPLPPTIREIPIIELIGDVVKRSLKYGVLTEISFVSGRWLVLIDAPDGHSATAYERT